MTINYTEYTWQEDYVDAVAELISRVEGFRSQVYRLDDGKATIGCGYTFNRNNNLALWTAAGISLNDADRAVLQEIDNANASEKTSIALSKFTRIITADEARALLGQTYPEYEGPANDLIMPLSPERVAFVAVTYNRGAGRVRATMSDFYQAVRDGDRAEAWFQIRYNSLGKDDKYINGKAKARYLESQIFGLYDDPDNVTLEDARSVYQMLQRHRLEIYNHEIKFGEKFDGTSGTRNMISEGNSDSNYQLVLNSFGLQRIDTITQALDSAKPVILSDLCNRYGEFASKLQDSAIKSTNIYMNPSKPGDTTPSILDARKYETTTAGENDVMIGNDSRDTILGGAGNDVLIGEGGNDYLEGGKGDDVLIGGSGFDTYYYKAGDGFDQISDTGENQIIIEKANGEFELIQAFYKTGDNIWTTPDGKIDITHHSPWQIVLEDGSTLTLGENLQDGDFGIHLKDVPANPTTTNEIIGDQDPENKTDIIADTPLNDRIEGRTGNDGIWASNGGDNWLLGDTGNDVVVAHDTSGNDILEGGSGTDIVVGRTGDDKLFGESYTEMQTHITQGETNPNIDAKGDLVSGGAGDNFVYGSDRQDALMGGEGSDLISGGAGDDVIMGDAALSATFIHRSLVVGLPDDPSYGFYLLVHSSQRDGVSTYYPIFGMADYYAVAPDKWTLKYSPAEGFTFRNIALEEKTGLDGKTYGGNDVIYAGAGNDAVFAGDGNDEVNAGPGDDIVFGQAGNDIISGGEGNDELQGNEGNDFIDGSSGNDVVFGGLGNDTLYGGEGNDYIEGNESSDYVDAGAGNDSISGGEGDDYLIGDDDPASIPAGEEGKNFIDGGKGNDQIWGGYKADVLYGGEGNDFIQGDWGTESGSDDYIDGGLGDDKLIGSGNDILVGGGGNDKYYYTGDTGGNITIVDDFSDDSEDNAIDFGNGTNPWNYTYQWNDGNGTWTAKRYGPFETINPYSNLTMPDCHRNDDGSIYGSVIFNGHIISFGEFLGSSYNLNEADFNSAGAAFTPPRRDPLILDLDGDGVETKRINTSTYFDHDADGFSEQTGWASSDDGLLVMDRDADGTIDNGTELFGNETLLANGTKATNGFSATADSLRRASINGYNFFQTFGNQPIN